MSLKLQNRFLASQIFSTARSRLAVGNGFCALHLAVGFFFAANVIRALLLRGTGFTAIQVDYAFIPAAAWIARRSGTSHGVQLLSVVSIAAVIVGGDIVDVMSRRFNWSHGVIIDYAYSMPNLPWPAILPILAVAVTAIGLCVLPFALHRQSFRIWPLGWLVPALLLSNVLLYQGARGDLELSRLTQSFVGHAIRGTLNRVFVGRSLEPFHGATMAAELDPSTAPAQILSVAMESLGLSRDPAHQQALLEPLLRPLEREYSILVGSHRSEGSTLPGEIRELCALQANGIPNTNALLAQLAATCLPARLRRAGYDTQALHGNGPLMYDRRAIYPAIGFGKAWFNADLRNASPDVRPCPGTAFAGVCDDEVYARALSLFNGDRRFVHVLTLDAHLPLSGKRKPDCPLAFQSDRGLCRYAQVTIASLRSLSRRLLAVSHRPDLIVVYGDHAPPFASESARNRFAPHEVPYLVLRRKLPGGRPH